MLFSRKVCQHCFFPGCTSVFNRTLPDPSQVSLFMLSKKIGETRGPKNYATQFEIGTICSIILFCLSKK